MTEPQLDVADIEVADDKGPTDVQINVVSKNAARAIMLQDLLIPEAMLALSKLQDEFKGLIEKTLPSAMDELKTGGFEYRDGNVAYDLKLDEAIQAGITEANKADAFAWLNKNGHGDLIKRQIVIEFSRDQQKLALKFMRDLAQRKTPLNPVIKETVHAATLKAFVKEQRQAFIDDQKNPDDAVPVTTFGVFKQRFVKFIVPKKKKGV